MGTSPQKGWSIMTIEQFRKSLIEATKPVAKEVSICDSIIMEAAKHKKDLQKGHFDKVVEKLVEKGFNKFTTRCQLVRRFDEISKKVPSNFLETAQRYDSYFSKEVEKGTYDWLVSVM